MSEYGTTGASPEDTGARTSPDGLSLIVELIPGSASNGVLISYAHGKYDLEDTFEKVVEKALRSDSATEDDKAIRNRVLKELGGTLVVRAEKVKKVDSIRNYCTEETATDSGAKYLMLPIRVVRSQEGGGYNGAFN